MLTRKGVLAVRHQPKWHEYSNFDAAPGKTQDAAPGETQEAASAHDNERQTTMQLDLPSPPPRFSPLPHNLPPPEPLSDNQAPTRAQLRTTTSE
ncbi:hypothetical protein ACM66B_002489 [Microbotryomycetes sp. NB124-2]